MNADFAFVHYSYDPDRVSPAYIHDRMTQLGFLETARHVNGEYSFWNQKNAIIMISMNDEYHTGISGLGFTMLVDSIDRHHLEFMFDPQTDTYFTTDPLDNIVTVMPDELDGNMYNFEVNMESALDHPGCGINNITGVVYGSDVQTLWQYYQDLDFRVSKMNRRSLVDAANRVEITCADPQDGKIRALVCDTPNVFATTSKLVTRDIEFKQFDLSDIELDFQSLTHKIRGYNCMAVGNFNSYSVENFVPNALPGMDLIIRTRKKYNHISHDTLSRYYGE